MRHKKRYEFSKKLMKPGTSHRHYTKVKHPERLKAAPSQALPAPKER